MEVEKDKDKRAEEIMEVEKEIDKRAEEIAEVTNDGKDNPGNASSLATRMDVERPKTRSKDTFRQRNATTMKSRTKSHILFRRPTTG